MTKNKLKVTLGENILALDIATKLGYCIKIGEKGIKEPNPSSVKLKVSTRELEFYEFVGALIDRYDINQVVYEDAAFQPNKASRAVFGGFVGVLKLICLQKGIKCHPLNVTTIKKTFTGNAKSAVDKDGKTDPKLNTMLKCKELGIDVGEDDDAADAYAVLYTWEKLQGRILKIR